MGSPLMGASLASKRDSSSRSSMMRVMRSVWRRISAIGRGELAEARVGAEGLEIAGHHGERRTQLVRGIGDEILAHLLEAHLARDVAQHQQALILAIGNELEGDVSLGGRIEAHDDRQRVLAAAQVSARNPDGAPDCRCAGRDPHAATGRAVSPALRLNQTISPCGSSMTTPSGMAAVERRSSRNRRVSRSLWNRLRRCRRTTCATTSPHRPMASGGSATLRCCSQNHSSRSCQRFQARYSASAPLMPTQTEPANQPTVAPSTSAASNPQRDVDEGRGAGVHLVREVATKSDNPNRARSGSGGRSRTLRVPCAGAGCARRSCAPRRRRCRPRRGRAAARACTRAPDAS